MVIVRLLVDRGLITDNKLNEVRKKKEGDRPLLATIIDNKLVNEQDVLALISENCSVPIVDIHKTDINYKAFKVLSVDFMQAHVICPFDFDEEGRLLIAMQDPTDMMLLDNLRQSLPYHILPMLSLGSDIQKKISCILEGESHFSDSLEKVEELASKKIEVDDAMLNAHSAILNAEKSPVVELVNNIIFDAVNEQASDIHIEPLEKQVELRYRVDGKLRVKSHIPKNIYRHLASRVKIMSFLDITETRRPQDGRVQTRVNGKNINLRVSTIPTIFGEKIVLRVLDPEEMDISLNHIGMDIEDLLNIQTCIQHPQGMVLVCGPTGSGKTSTLYGALKEMRSPEKNILTIEDPVEYTVEGINQIQVNDKIGFTFASGLRTILRQDPDCILVGEIRDDETAQIAFRASLTGHLVLSTIHTNNSIAAVTRLKDIGIEPFLIASSMLCILSQRLVRVNCEHCKQIYMPPPYLIDRYKMLFPENQQIHFYRGHGCEECRFTGFKGRTGIFEFLSFSNKFREMICNNVSETELQSYAKRHLGFRTMVEAGIDKVVSGITTLEELDSIIGKQCDHGDPAESQANISQEIISKNVKEFVKMSVESLNSDDGKQIPLERPKAKKAGKKVF